MAERAFDLVVIGAGARRLCVCNTGRPTWLESRHCRTRAYGRHLSQLGLYSNQSDVAIGGGVPLNAACKRIRIKRQRHRLRS